VRQKLLNLDPSELRNLRTLRPGGCAVRTERNETRFVLAKVKSQSHPASGESRSRTQLSALTITNERSWSMPLPDSYNSMQSVI
jgi:hypothetical protein